MASDWLELAVANDFLRGSRMERGRPVRPPSAKPGIDGRDCKRVPSRGAKSPRRKLWQVPAQFHCSLVGTCLSLEELKQLVDRIGLSIEQPASDHCRHGALVQSVSDRQAAGRVVHRHLDRKFSDCIRRFGAAEDETGLRQLWESVSQTSDIAAGYWALLSHPLVTAALAQRAFGEVHMLSHVSAAASRRAHTELAAARERIRDRSAALARMRTALNSKSIAKHSLEARLAVALGALAMSTRLGAEQLPESTDCDIEHLRSQIEIARAAARRARQVARERRQRMRAAEARCTKLTLALQQWQISAASQGREEAPSSASETAVGEAREPLPLDLNGQRIAYVGGRINLTSRLRAFTESHNGEFLHHDGGRHESPTRLLAVIERADVVLCPLDCVSHDACERLKRQCKRSGKRFKLLRTSSVSAFTDGLIEVESR